MALAEVLALVDSGQYSTLVFDTAPTGHTLRLLQLPQVLKAGIEKMQSWQTRLGGVMGAIAGAFNKDSDAAAQANSLNRLREKLKHYQVQVERIADIFRDVDKTQFVCVCIAEHLSVFETVRLVTELRKQGISQSHVLVNQLVPRAFASMAATDSTGKSRLPLQSLAGALAQLGLEAGLVNAAKEACELMGARSKIQAYYLNQLAGSLSEATIVRLPLLAKDLRGADNIAEFSKNMVVVCDKLQDGAAPALTQASSGSEEMLAKLNSLLAAAEDKEDEEEVGASAAKRAKMEAGAAAVGAAATPKPAEAAAGGVPPMMLLMQLQGVLGQPDGLQKVLTHVDVVAARKSTPVVEDFCAAVEMSGPMAALGFLGNPAAMTALQAILPGVLKDVTAAPAAAAPAAGGGSMDDDIYD
jgi:anion-transporting  ArsA/GET3 family ATPase